MSHHNEFLDHGFSEESDGDPGYDSEAAEVSKTARKRDAVSRSAKRRKLSHASSDESEHDVDTDFSSLNTKQPVKSTSESEATRTEAVKSRDAPPPGQHEVKSPADAVRQHANGITSTEEPEKNKKEKKEPTPGVIYLSSLPPYLKPSALRNILTQRGFGPVTRLFLTPASKHKHGSKKNSRQLYTEGWIEFASKKTARRCAEALNAQSVGGRKGGFYRDDIWNMKYLKGMSWEELMAGMREERREEEARRDEERRRVAKETQTFMEGVEQGRRLRGMERKRKAKEGDEAMDGDEDNVKRTWRQYEVAGGSKKPMDGRRNTQKDGLDENVHQVLAKIF